MSSILWREEEAEALQLHQQKEKALRSCRPAQPPWLPLQDDSSVLGTCREAARVRRRVGGRIQHLPEPDSTSQGCREGRKAPSL